MSINSFWKLCELLDPYLQDNNKRYEAIIPNGVILSLNKVSIALQYFADRGSPLDIA
jgi:hypothetical protein